MRARIYACVIIFIILLLYTVHVYAEAVCAFVRGDVCAYVRACARICAGAYIHTYVWERVRTRVRECERVHVRERLHVRVCARLRLRVRTCARDAAHEAAHVSVCACVGTHACAGSRTCGCACVRACMRACILCMYDLPYWIS